MLYNRGTPYWTHVTDWFKASQQFPNDILILFFEDIVSHRKEAVERIATFIGGKLTEKGVD